MMNSQLIRLLLLTLLTCCWQPLLQAQTTKIRTTRVETVTDQDKKLIIEKIQKQEKQWDEKAKMLAKFIPSTANHYHSALVNRTLHPVRDAAGYASDLLDSQVPQYQQRAFQVIERVIARQDQDPRSETYGVWPYYDEESLPQMAKPDWNWADFVSVRLLESYINHGDVIPASLKEKMKGSIIHAANSIQKRDVKPGYTNIAIMGTFVTYVTSHLFNLPPMQSYADMRLKRFYDFTQDLNGFAEYNSPTYTKVALDELARMKKYIVDPEALRMTNACYRIAWQGLAKHFHAPTGQLAGPHSRSYSTLLKNEFYELLYEGSNGRVQYQGAQKSSDHYKLPHQIPADLLDNFRVLKQAQVSIDTFGLESMPPVGYTYLHPKYNLGTVSRGNMWEQRRPYIAYWGKVEKPKYFRVRLLHDLVDFATGQVFSSQKEGQALTALTFAVDGGDYHNSLDKLTNGNFEAKDLRLRFEIGDAGLYDKIQVNGQAFSLADEGINLDVQMLASQFDKANIEVKKGKDDKAAWVDWIIHSGARRHFTLADMQQAFFAWTTDFSGSPARQQANQKPLVAQTGGFLDANWQGMRLRVPVKPNSQDYLQSTAKTK